jgi:hypothetical protein
MRTKALILTAALCAAGLTTATAQQTVYSVNAVGYVNLTVKPGFQMIANPLMAEDNTVEALLTSAVPDGTIIYKFDAGSGTFQINQFIATAPGQGIWTISGMELMPGEGAFIYNPGDAITITFVGDVPQGDLSQDIPMGLSIQASQVPQAGALDADLGYPAQDGDIVYQFNEDAQTYDINQVIDAGGTIIWTLGQPPSLDVGESVFVSKQQAATWSRSFSVNN